MAIVAYKERESFDPQTGEPGILRTEWRVRTVATFRPEELAAAFGPDWQRYKPFASHVLEHRYIRRGKEEPWTPFNAANSFDQALAEVDSGAVAVHPTLKKLQREREEYAEEQRRKKETESRLAAEREEREYHAGRSDEAFRKLAASKDGVWAERWNAFVSSHSDAASRDRVRNDAEFMQLYKAVMAAETVPAKRVAIRKFLSYAEGVNYSGGEWGPEAKALIAGRLPLSLIKFPSGKWGFVGSVPVNLRYDPTPTAEQVVEIKQVSTPALVLKRYGIKTRVWNSREEAIEAAENENGITIE